MKKNTNIIPALLLALLTTSLASAQTDDAARLKAAREAVEQKVVFYAQDILEKLYEQPDSPDRFEVTILLARCHFERKKYKEAYALLENFELNFKGQSKFNMAAQYWRSRAALANAEECEKQKKASLLKIAREGFEDIIKDAANPKMIASSRFFLGQALFEENKLTAALAQLRGARKIGLERELQPLLSLYLGRAMLTLGDFAQAAVELTAFTKTYPDDEHLADALYWLGDAHYYLEEWEHALTAYERSILSAPTAAQKSRARYALSWSCAKLSERITSEGRQTAGRARKVQALRERALKNFLLLTNHEEDFIRISSAFEVGEMLFLLSRFEEAAEKLLVLTDPMRYPRFAPKALYYLGRSRLNLGRFELAIGAFRRALENKVDSELEMRIRFAAGRAHVRARRIGEALRIIAPLLEPTRPRSAQSRALFEITHLLLEASRAASKRSEKSEASRHLEDAWLRISALLDNKELMAELRADKVNYQRGRIAHDGALMEGQGGARTELWSLRAIEGYTSVGSWNEWTERALLDLAALYQFRNNPIAAKQVFEKIISAGKDASTDAELAARLAVADILLARAAGRGARLALLPITQLERLAEGREDALYKIAIAQSLEAGDDPTRILASTERFKKFLSDFPKSVWNGHVHFALGEQLLKLNDFEQAASQFGAILKEHPNFEKRDHAQLLMGNSLLALGKNTEAKAQYSELFRHGISRDLRARAGVAEAKMELRADNTSTALELVNKVRGVLGSTPLAQEVEFLRGEILMSQERFGDASAAFKAACLNATGELATKGLYWHGIALLKWAESGRLGNSKTVLLDAAHVLGDVHFKYASSKYSTPSLLASSKALISLADKIAKEGNYTPAEVHLNSALAMLTPLLKKNIKEASELEIVIKRQLKIIMKKGESK